MCCFESSKNFMDWHKNILFPMRLLSTAASEWLETTSGMVLIKITFMLNLARWTGQTAISNNFFGFWKNALLPKSIPLLFQLRKISRTYDVLYACYKCFSGVTEVEELVHSSPPQISTQIPPTIVKNEQDIVVLYVCEQSTINSAFRCNVSEIWISRFVYLENDAIFAFRGNSYFRLAVEGW